MAIGSGAGSDVAQKAGSEDAANAGSGSDVDAKTGSEEAANAGSDAALNAGSDENVGSSATLTSLRGDGFFGTATSGFFFLGGATPCPATRSSGGSQFAGTFARSFDFKPLRRISSIEPCSLMSLRAVLGPTPRMVPE